MTRRLLTIVVAAAFAVPVLGVAPASACQSDTPCPQSPTCSLLPKTCIYPV